MLHTSSGAVYGKQPAGITHMPEDAEYSPDIYNHNAAYGEGKRVAEMLGAFYYRQYGIESKIARCFAFVGPYLPLDTHFAIGNFIKDALRKVPIRVNGDGTPYRSYLYASDLAIWLWTILFQGTPCRPYNIGSDQEVSIAALADKVTRISRSGMEVQIAEKADKEKPAQRYVPSIERVRTELNLEVTVSLDDAIRKTIDFYS